MGNSDEVSGSSMWYHSFLADWLNKADAQQVIAVQYSDVLTASKFVGSIRKFVTLFSQLADEDQSVILISDKSLLLLPAIVAAGIVGKTYVPVSPDTPDARLDSIKAGLSVEKVFNLADLETDSDFEEDGQSYEEQLQELNNLLGSAKPFPSDKAVYILFTSGSTGQPKGVMISQKNIEFFTNWAFAEYSFSGDDILIAQVPETFDLAVLDIFACLKFGCKLILIPKSISSDPVQLIDIISEHKATSIFSTPSFFNLLALDRNFNAESLPSLDRFLLCGEVFQKTLAKKLLRFFPQAGIYNLYGPTEATVAVTSVRITNELTSKDGSLPIGRPMGTTECVFLNENGQESTENTGEMVFCGDTIGIGYVKMPEKTAEVFIELKDENQKSIKAYRTGDIGELAEDGNLYYKGRIDNQIKWSGYRIEIGEIEHHLNNVSFVEAAAILPIKLANGDVAALVAYVVTQDKQEDEESLIAEISKHLPSYMLPSAYKFIDKMPVTSHGKIDKKELGLIHEKLRRS